jgi:hypothetical protein
MRKHNRLFLSLLVPAFLVLGGYDVVQAQQKASSTAGGKRWSDAATWPDKKVPGKDDVVTIENDMDVHGESGDTTRPGKSSTMRGSPGNGSSPNCWIS